MPDIESLLEQLGKDAGPSKAFEQRLLSQLRRRHVMMQSEEKAPAHERFFSYHFLRAFGKRGFSTLVAGLFIASTGGISTYAYTSDNVTRDSFLYPVKKTLESVEKSFVSTPEETVQFHLKMMERRLAEVRHISEVRGVADEATLKDFSTEFNEGVTVVAALPQPAQREVFFKKFENVIDTHEKIFIAAQIVTDPVITDSVVRDPIVADPVVLPAVAAPSPKENDTSVPQAESVPPAVLPTLEVRVENRSDVAPIVPVPEITRHRDVRREGFTSPHLEAIQQRLQEARQEIAQERVQLESVVAPTPLPVEATPVREEIREQREVIRSIREEKRTEIRDIREDRREEKRENRENRERTRENQPEEQKTFSHEQALEKIFDPVVTPDAPRTTIRENHDVNPPEISPESPEGPRLDIVESPENNEPAGPRMSDTSIITPETQPSSHEEVDGPRLSIESPPSETPSPARSRDDSEVAPVDDRDAPKSRQLLQQARKAIRPVIEDFMKKGRRE